MRKHLPIPLIIILFGSIALFLLGRETIKFVSNLIWLFSLPPLPKHEYPFGIFSAPGGGLFALFLICIPLILYAALRLSRRKR